MGFTVSWITPLVIAAVVDRNPTATKDLSEKFNRFIREVRNDLRRPEGKQALADESKGLCQGANTDIDEAVLETLPEDFFIDFAGQGRLRWHRGVAYPILAGIRAAFSSRYGRGWLNDEASAKSALLLPLGGRGFSMFDMQTVGQAIAAFAIICGNM
jgi:hypothetical protein